MNVSPVTLNGRVVRLEPLDMAHLADLTKAGEDESLWQYLPYGAVAGRERMADLIAGQLADQAEGTDLPFAVRHLEANRIVGMTRYLEIRPVHRGLEIGGTWYAPAYQRTAVNTECKLLLLTHAFDVLGTIRVQLKTDARNVRSQRAIERIGAVREGVLRQHIIMPDGFIRDTVYYSIVRAEWPVVRADLVQKLLRD